MSWIMRFLSSDIVKPFRVWGPRNSSHNGRKSKGITPECFDVRPLPCPHNPPRPLPPSRGDAASSKGKVTWRRIFATYRKPLFDNAFQFACFFLVTARITKTMIGLKADRAECQKLLMYRGLFLTMPPAKKQNDYVRLASVRQVEWLG